MMDQENTLSNEQLTLVLNLLQKKFKEMESKFGELLEIQKSQDKALEKQTIYLEELGKNGGGSANNGGGSIVSKEDLELQLKELLLNDEELLETFSKVIENITTYNQNKEKLRSYVDNERSKKKKKSPIFLIGFSIFTFILFLGYLIYSFLNTKEIIIQSNTYFYEMNKTDPLTFPTAIKVETENEDDINYYFIYQNKKYYVPKVNIK